MEELVRYLVSLLVDVPEEVHIQTTTTGTAKIYEVYVAPEDLGKVIGRHGRTANALRSIVEAAARRHGEKASVDIVS